MSVHVTIPSPHMPLTVLVPPALTRDATTRAVLKYFDAARQAATGSAKDEDAPQAAGPPETPAGRPPGGASKERRDDPSDPPTASGRRGQGAFVL